MRRRPVPVNAREFDRFRSRTARALAAPSPSDGAAPALLPVSSPDARPSPSPSASVGGRPAPRGSFVGHGAEVGFDGEPASEVRFEVAPARVTVRRSPSPSLPFTLMAPVPSLPAKGVSPVLSDFLTSNRWVSRFFLPLAARLRCP